MDNLDQGFFSSGLDSFDMGVIQNRLAVGDRDGTGGRSFKRVPLKGLIGLL